MIIPKCKSNKNCVQAKKRQFNVSTAIYDAAVMLMLPTVSSPMMSLSLLT